MWVFFHSALQIKSIQQTRSVSGRAEVVAVLLRDPRDLDAMHRGLTPLHFAARYGHDQVVRMLLAAGARCQADADVLTPLDAAARSGSAPTVRLLLGAAPPPAAEVCWRAAWETAGHAHEEACSALLDELEARGLLQWGPEAREVLYEAGCGGSSAIALRLLGLPTAALGERLHDNGETVLHAAAANGRAELVRALLSRGADPLGEDAEGSTALDLAALGGSTDTITALVEHIPGGSLQAALGEALRVAARYGQLGAAQRLVHHGAVVNAKDGERWTPLGCAPEGGATEVVRWLLQQGADPSLGERLPLHLAALYGRLSVVKLLVPPLHAGDQAQDPPGGEEPSALSVAVQAGSREDLQRILGQFVEHLRPLSSRYTREDRLRDKAEATAALRRKEKGEGERLRLLQQVDSGGLTALHTAAAVSALPVVEYLLEREGELLQRIYSKHKNTGVPRLDGLTVYARRADGHTALQCGALMLCAPSVAEALLRRMGDEMWLALGHRDLQEVRGMAVEALWLAGLAAYHLRGGGRLVRALCEGLLGEKNENRLQDIRSGAVAALCSGQHVWHAVVDLVRWHLEALPLNLPDLRLCALRAMRRCLQLGPRGEKALQLLSLWVRDLRDLREGAVHKTHERVAWRIAAEALRIAVERRDQDSFQVIRRLLWRAKHFTLWIVISLALAVSPAAVFMMWVLSLLS
ncbi:hypothetical protein FOCC_FOCC000543 [Frankliniella occidentalis]|nr:hypothetical protein FOCC_FOCC000543 [Frankliniella occidentalis]